MKPIKQLKIAVVDDCQQTRTLLQGLIKRMPEAQLSFTATNGNDLLFKLKLFQVDLILLDLYMPFMSGWEVLEHLPKNGYAGKVICMSSGYYPVYNDQLRRFEVHAYISKEEHLIEGAIASIKSGQPLLHPPLRIPPVEREEHDSTEYVFTETELCIVQELANGLDYKEISDKKLKHLSMRSIEAYTQHLIKHLNLRSRTHLISYAYAHGLLRDFEFSTQLEEKKANSRVNIR